MRRGGGFLPDAARRWLLERSWRLLARYSAARRWLRLLGDIQAVTSIGTAGAASGAPWLSVNPDWRSGRLARRPGARRTFQPRFRKALPPFLELTHLFILDFNSKNLEFIGKSHDR